MDNLDPRLTQIATEEQAKQQEYNTMYDQLVQERQQLTEQQKGLVDTWGIQQNSLANQQNQLTLDKIEQDKQQLTKDYTKEQTGAYTDYQKQTGSYGVQAEQQASQGMAGGGYSETAKTSMYSAYQNRISVARDTYVRAITQFSNTMKEAQLSYNTRLAEISYQQLERQLTLAASDFDYKNSAWQNKVNYQNTLSNTYYGRRQDVQSQMNYEQQQLEAKRQWEAEMAYKQQQDALSQANWEKEYALAVKKANASSATSTSTTSTSSTPQYVSVGGGYYQIKGDTSGATYVIDGNTPIRVGSAEYAQMLSYYRSQTPSTSSSSPGLKSSGKGTTGFGVTSSSSIGITGNKYPWG